MSEAVLDRQVESGVAVLTMCRPDRRNALSRALVAALAEAIEGIETDDRVRAVILTGAGSSFCAGMDLEELRATIDTADDPGTAGLIWEDALALSRLLDRIYRLPKPTIAAVNGAAVAGGAGLMTVCDLALAVPTARFGYPEVRRGLVAAMVMPHLLRHVGERAARRLLLVGDLIDAHEAERIGLINQVVEAGELLGTAHRWARELIAGGPKALQTTKALLAQFSRQSFSVADLARASAEPRLTDECRAGLTAFFEKKSAPWESATGSTVS